MKWFIELDNVKESFLCWMILILHRLMNVPISESLPLVNGVYTVDDFVFDDYVFDKHTSSQRFSDPKGTQFASVGAYVANESVYVIAEHKRFYEQLRGVAPGVAPGLVVAKVLETSYTFIVRTQINTSASKTDVYFATSPDGELVVVKGPLASTTAVNNMLEIQQWKKSMNLPYVDAKLVMMIPDRWPEGIPLGKRNSVNRKEEHPFLISKSLISEELLVHRKMHSSKLWPPTEIVDWEKVPLHFSVYEITDQEKKDYIEALLCRYLFGISDLADRNFLMVNGRVISVDEEYRDHVVDFQKELRKNRCSMVYLWVDEMYSYLGVSNWTIPDELKTCEVRLEIVKNKEECLALF